MAALPRTYLAFQHNASLTSLTTLAKSIFPATTLSEPNRALFKGITFTPQDHIVITPSTIFHPQGGGQPSDTGTMTNPDTNTTFTITAVRTATTPDLQGQVLHLGTFAPASTPFTPSASVTQHLDVAKRQYYSRLHTAGHVLGSAVRHLCEPHIADFDELKANHFPDAAACEFRGVIAGEWKDRIQRKVDEFVAADMDVRIEWWAEEDFVREGLERLMPERSVVGVEEGEKFRVVRIVGAEVYPCGGTHVESTAGCGRTTVRKISRQKGISKVSYAVEVGKG